MKYYPILTFLLYFIIPQELFAQKLFRSFVFQMPINEAKAILLKESKTLKNLNFGKGTNYSFRKRSFVERNGNRESFPHRTYEKIAEYIKSA